MPENKDDIDLDRWTICDAVRQTRVNVLKLILQRGVLINIYVLAPELHQVFLFMSVITNGLDQGLKAGGDTINLPALKWGPILTVSKQRKDGR